MRPIHFITAAALLALAGCGQSGSKSEGNQAAAAAPAGAAGAPGSTGVHLQPGLWETMVDVVSVDAPGMPKQARDMMAKTMGGGKVTVRHCVTPEEASRPNGDLFAGKKNEGNCSYKDFNVTGGRVHGTMSCTGEGGQGAMTMAMDGQFNPQSYAVSQKMTISGQGGPMTIESRVSGRRTGDCQPGKEG